MRLLFISISYFKQWQCSDCRHEVQTHRLYFHAFELFTVLASADGNEVFAGTLGALEITKS